METDYKRAIKYALEEKRLWAAGLIAALAFSQAWWIVFGWGPEYLGERWERALGGRLGEAGAFFAFLLAALAAFVVLKAFGYLGEMLLVRQVADGQIGEIPAFTQAFSGSQRRYLPFAVTLLPWDALRIALIYAPAVIIALWDRWDPSLDHIFLYLAVILLWFAVMVASEFFVGITAALAARFSLLDGRAIGEAWREGWGLLRAHTMKCGLVWLQVLAAAAAFVVVAWPLSALLPWVADQVADPIGFAPARWLMRIIAYVLLAGGLIVMQAGVQCYRSSLWTMTYLRLVGEGTGESLGPIPLDSRDDVETFQPPLTDLPGPPPDFMPSS
ncbi:MAG: hypothetical protein AB1384_00915 [Actinomycetota bacterium]